AHAARLEFLGDLVEQPDRATWIASTALHDRAHEIAELLVGGVALRRAGEDPLRDLGLTAEERDVRDVLGRARRALPAEPVPRRDLSALHPRACQAEEGVAPDRRAVRAKALLGLGEGIDRGVVLPGVPLGEASGVRRPGRFPGIAHPDREPRGRV